MKHQDMLFNDIFDKPVEFTKECKKNTKNISGNSRLRLGKFRTTKQSKAYSNKTLERVLP